MKTIAKTFCIALLAMFTLTMPVSCDMLGNETEGEENVTGWENYTAGWTEEGNKLIYKQSFDYGIAAYTQILIFEFKDDKCIKATGEFIWPSAEFAMIYFNALDEATKPNASVSGQKVTIDLTADFRDLSKSELKAAIDAADQWS